MATYTHQIIGRKQEQIQVFLSKQFNVEIWLHKFWEIKGREASQMLNMEGRQNFTSANPELSPGAL